MEIGNGGQPFVLPSDAPRIVFLGTSDFAVPTLEKLMGAGQAPVAVYTRADQPAGRGRALQASPVKERALALGLPVLQPPTLRRPEALEELRALRPTVLVLAAYGLILPGPFLQIPPKGGLNVHPSLLPRHRGASPVTATLLEGDAEAGVTIFLMDAGMDSGPILRQRHSPIGADDDAGTLTARLAREGADLLVETLPAWLGGQIVPFPQDEGKATFSRTLQKGDGELDFREPAERLARRVRALQPWPGTFTRWNGLRLRVLKAAAVRGTGGPGEVVQLPGEKGGPAFGIATTDGVLGLLVVQAEGKKPVTVEEFVRGRRDFVGALLPS